MRHPTGTLLLSIACIGLGFLAWPQIRSFFPGRQLGLEPAVEETTEKISEKLESPIERARTVRIPELVAPDEQIVDERDVIELSTDSTDPFLAEVRSRVTRDPQAAMDWLAEQPAAADRLRGMLEAVAVWAADDAESALLWLEANAQGIARFETLTSGVELWAERSPNEAANWVDGMANDGGKVAAARSLVATWAREDPNAAADWVDGLPDGQIRNEAVVALAESWMVKAPESAAIWVYEEARRQQDPILLDETIRQFSQVAPSQAEAFVRALSQQPGAGDSVVETHIRGRAEQDPSEAAQWLTSLTPDDPLYRSENAGVLMDVWAESDSIAASMWLSELPAGEQRDAAAASFSGVVQNYDPEVAVEWAASISDPNQRVERLSESLQVWMETNPLAADEWISSRDLDPVVRAYLSEVTNSIQ